MVYRDTYKVNHWLTWSLVLVASICFAAFPLGTLSVLALIFSAAVLIHGLIKLIAATWPATSTLTEKPDRNYQPLVSVQIACSSEPAAVVNRTLTRLSKQEYQNFEVLVIHNNNQNRENYEQIAEHCRTLGDNFRFYHVDHVNGFKAGALNILQQFANPKTEIVAVIDSDYLVEKDYLAETVGYFADAKVGIVQAPQDYIDVTDRNIGLALEYRSFFTIQMNQAQALGAVTFTGTMGLIRAELFKKSLRWNEWCITEDTEAGIFINSQGYRGVYVDKSFGRGMMPLDYNSLRTQRQRWAYGNMQILTKNFYTILRSHHLSWRQKYSFMSQLIAWLQFDLAIAALYLLLGAVSIFIPMSSLGIPIRATLFSLAASLVLSFLYYWLGLRKLSRRQKGARIMAFLTHTGLVETMSASWIKFLLGKKLGFMVTNKNAARRQRSGRAALKESAPAIFLAAGLVSRYVGGAVSWRESAIVGCATLIFMISVLYDQYQLSAPVPEEKVEPKKKEVRA